MVFVQIFGSETYPLIHETHTIENNAYFAPSELIAETLIAFYNTTQVLVIKSII
jgi:hypothetical protein